MPGLSRRKSSGVWQGRFYIPSEIWTERDRLIEFGVKIGKNQDYPKSLGERSKGEAEVIRFAFGWLGANLNRDGRLLIFMADPIQEFLAEVEAIPLSALSHFIMSEQGKDIGPYRSMFLDYLSQVLKVYRDQLGQDLVSGALDSYALAVTEGSRSALDKAGSVFAGRALETLQARLVDMDYTPPAWGLASLH